jgi:uncharacterized protein YigE (DUF2233 family)
VESAAGVETVNTRGGNAALELRLLRLAPHEWSTNVVDMRALRQMKARRGSYTAPSHSLAELASVTGADRILASAGMTDSLYAPVPVGLLKSGGAVRNKANTTSRILDGLLCVRADRSVHLLSETTPAGRRIPQNWTAATAACTHAVQAGPMLVDRGDPLIAARGRLSTARVFAAVDRQGRFVLGYAPQATTFDLACALAAPVLGIAQAIALQGDELGGVWIGARAGPGAAKWGQDTATLASALEVVRLRPQRQDRRP